MTPNQIRFGLMPVLDAALELPRTVLPLKSVRYHFVARGGMAEVEMTQVYRQENAEPLDCEYVNVGRKVRRGHGCDRAVQKCGIFMNNEACIALWKTGPTYGNGWPRAR